jgi:hypothetical protein
MYTTARGGGVIGRGGVIAYIDVTCIDVNDSKYSQRCTIVCKESRKKGKEGTITRKGEVAGRRRGRRKAEEGGGRRRCQKRASVPQRNRGVQEMEDTGNTTLDL